MSKQLEFYGFNDLPSKIQLGILIGASIGTPLMNYLEFKNQQHNRFNLQCYLNIFGAGIFGGLIGGIAGFFSTVLWPIVPCLTANGIIAAVFASKCAQLK